MAVTCGAEPPLSLLFPADALAKYARLFCVQLRLEHSEFLLHQVFVQSRDWDAFFGVKVSH